MQVACSLYFIVHTQCYAMLQHIENLNGLFITFYCLHFVHQVTLQRIESLNGFLTIFYRLTLNIRDDRMYNSTTNQCGARSGSPQIKSVYKTDLQ